MIGNVRQKNVTILDLTLHLTGIYDDKTLHKYLSKMLSFHFDAFSDYIRDDGQSTIARTLNIIRLIELASHLPREAKLLEQSLLDYQKECDVHLIFA